ncbi:MAG: anti-sigma factor family protein [Betaproteobacteria bacterium]
MSDREPCPRIESLSSWIDGEMADAERNALQAHVAGCPVCQPVVAQLQQTRSLFAELPHDSIDFDLAPAIDRLIASAASGVSAHPLRANRGPRRRIPWWRWAALVPGGTLAVAVGLWLGASLMPAGALPRTGATGAQMAAFSATPPGSLCPAPAACGGPVR